MSDFGMSRPKDQGTRGRANTFTDAHASRDPNSKFSGYGGIRTTRKQTLTWYGNETAVLCLVHCNSSLWSLRMCYCLV